MLERKEWRGAASGVRRQSRLSLLRFESDAAIDEHSAAFDIDVICLDGAGFTKVGEEVAAFAEGDRVRWPSGIVHGLWTEGHAMLTLMVEHH